MIIARRMTKHPVVANQHMSTLEALDLMKRKGVAKLPVLDDNMNLVGILTEKDILRASLPEVKELSLLEMAYQVGITSIESIMTRDVISITPDTGIEEAARIMVMQDLSFLPVVKDGKLEGVVSKSDMFKILMDLFGARVYGARITLALDDKVGMIAKISKILADNNLSIISFCNFSDDESGKVICTLKVEGTDEKTMRKLLSPLTIAIVDEGEV